MLYGTLSGEPISIDPRLMISDKRPSRASGWATGCANARSRPLLLLFREIATLIRKGVLDSEIGRIATLDEIADAARHAETVARHGKVLLRL